MKVRYWVCSLAGASIYATMLAGQSSDPHFVSRHQPAISAALLVGAVLLVVQIYGLEYGDDKERDALQFLVEIGVVILSALALVLNGAVAIFMYSDTAAHNELVVIWCTYFDLVVEVVMTVMLWRCSRKKSPV